MSTPPASFSILGWTAAPTRGEIAFAYHCSRYGDFVETYRFPQAALAALTSTQHALLNLAAITIGVSYYKANACGRIVLTTPFANPAARDLAHALYSEGLGEFYVRNSLPYPPHFVFEPAEPASSPPANAQRNAQKPERAVVAFGGGMDSHVALGLVERAGVSAALTSVTMSDNIKRVIADCSDAPVTFIERALDQRLLAANRAGALNGHIPVTAINSLILILHASFTGAGWVVFANEKSADEVTMTIGGYGVNHQFSKTLRAEALLREAVRAAGPDTPDYFSALRPVSELWIARELAQLPRSLARFRSCNRNFVLSDKARMLDGQRWCGQCAKCVFTALIMAPFLRRAQSVDLFGADVLEDPANLPLAEELAGFTGAKPWECVGTVEEVSAALSHLADDPDWQGAQIVAALAQRVRDRSGAAALAAHFSEAMIASGAHFLPPAMDFAVSPERV